MGQDEDPEPLVRRADFCRAEQARRRRVAHAPKVSQHGFKTKGDMPGNVFEEDPFWGAFADDTGDVGPEVAGIIGATALACGAEGLTGVSRKDDVEGAAKGPGFEAAQIIPDRGLGEIPVALGGDEDGTWPILPFDKCACVISWFGEHEAQIQASAACAEGQSVPGT